MNEEEEEEKNMRKKKREMIGRRRAQQSPVPDGSFGWRELMHRNVSYKKSLLFVS